jgi:uncharacterized protein GlcG (DUF336 family)
MKKALLMGMFFCTVSVPAFADDGAKGCALGGGVIGAVQAALNNVVSDGNGGIFTPNMMWAAVVDRNGILCGTVKVGDAWPGSRAIAIAKAETANDFSNNKLALSTANLYAPTQPGGSLYGLNNSNPFNPFFNAITTNNSVNPIRGNGVGFNPGGIITFGGGVALYGQGSQVIGGLGVSGDTACADHSIAYRIRGLLKLNHIPGGVGLNGTDNILYAANGATPTGFQHPHCGATDVVPKDDTASQQ